MRQRAAIDIFELPAHRHAMRNAAIPIITIVGLQLGNLLGGAVVTETIFSWPGIGRLAIQSIFARDYPVVQSCVFMTAVMFVILNCLVDIAYGLAKQIREVAGKAKADSLTAANTQVNALFSCCTDPIRVRRECAGPRRGNRPGAGL